MSDTPDILYQYYRPDGKTVFRDMRLQVSHPHYLNDPFEWDLSVIPETDPKKVMESLEFLYQRGRAMPKPTPAMVAAVKAHLPQSARYARLEWRQLVDDSCRIACFSETNRGVLLWAHYTNHHKGFVIGYDLRILKEQFPHGQLCKVDYDKPRHFVKLMDGGSTIDKIAEAVRIVMFRKSPEWRMEEEWRLLLLKEHLETGKNDKGNTREFLHLKPDIFKSVIFGSRCEDALKCEIIDLVKQQGIQAGFFDAYLEETEYKIGIREHPTKDMI